MKFIGLSIFIVGQLWIATAIAEEIKSFPALDSKLINRVEALKRISPSVIESNPSMKGIVENVFQSLEGRPEYVELSIRFHRVNHIEKLLDFAEKYPDHFASSEAIKFLIENDLLHSAESRLNKSAESKVSSNLIPLLSATGSESAFQVLLRILNKEDSTDETKKAIIRSFSATLSGAHKLIELEKKSLIPPSLKLYSGQILSLVPWAKVRESASKVFPASKQKGALGLSLSDISKFPADIIRGKAVFNDPVAGCLRCHKVSGKGVGFGPELTQIGDKLPPEALLESIQNPSAGIAFGFEAWEIELDTTEYLYGIIISETEDFIILRDTLGVDQKISLDSIVDRAKSPVSAMPIGLSSLITPGQMADLIAYLSSLKK